MYARTNAESTSADYDLRNEFSAWDAASDELDIWSSDPDVSCALPDMRPIVLTVIGAAVVTAALMIAIVRRVRRAS